MDMQIKCYDDRHYVIIGSIFAPALIAYVIGIPVMFFVLLRKNINTLAEVVVYTILALRLQ